MLFLISAVLLTGASVVEAIHIARKKIEALVQIPADVRKTAPPPQAAPARTAPASAADLPPNHAGTVLRSLRISLHPQIFYAVDSPLSRRLRFLPGTLLFRQPLTDMSETTSAPKITAYLKTFCGWSEGIRAIMRKYDLPYEEKDIIKNPAFRWEMEQRSGQSLSPCVEIDGHMLPDISGEEVEKWMLGNGYFQRNDAAPDAPINSACTDAEHEAMALGRLPAAGKIRFLD